MTLFHGYIKFFSEHPLHEQSTVWHARTNEIGSRTSFVIAYPTVLWQRTLNLRHLTRL